MSNPAQEEFNELVRDKNRSTRHPEDADDSDLDSGHESPTEQFFEKDDYSDDADDYHRHDDAVDFDDMRSRYTVPHVRSDANTGPKGVIADAQAFEQAKKSQRFSLFRSSDDKKERNMVRKNRADTTFSEKSVGSGSEDEFLARWRENRLRELQSNPKGQRALSRSRSRTGSPGSRAYGRLVHVDADGYLDAVEKTASSTTVVVFVYDDQSEISTLVEDALRTLARRHGMVKFIKFHYEDAEMHVAGVPAILAYRGGEKFAGLVPVMDEIPDDSELSDVTLEYALQR
ncbi:hypothetical protein SLS56_006015 [Neofusicoccum ribis]|uniref:Phosducin domain-containing protein n=1 Tax=Neofusicoccum ribis TaxID=45134 RepID=A0ABR3SST3_9PEZI